MLQAENILISVEYDYVLRMLNGLKTAEVRRRQLRIRPGTRVWVYSKLPRGRVELVATVDRVIAASPRRLWQLYQKRIAITSSEFKTYFRRVDIGCVILLRNIRPLQPALELDMLRRTARNFHPPQFFKRLVAHGPEMKTLASSFSPS
jgi:predicted transcriptional regulator